MKVLFKGVGQPVRALTIKNDLEDMQSLVGGYIETVQLTENVVMVVNEEGKLHGLEPNFLLWNDYIVGDVFFCGVDGEEFADCPESEYGINTILEELR